MSIKEILIGSGNIEVLTAVERIGRHVAYQERERVRKAKAREYKRQAGTVNGKTIKPLAGK